MDIASLISRQNPDGGWPYRKGGSSWTEPTVFALLAQLSGQSGAPSVERGFAWLRATQRRDGGWSPCPAITESTWVTAMPALLPAEILGVTHHASAIEWLLGQSGQETSLAFRIRNQLLGNSAGLPEANKGWPFFPGAAAWVTPTAMSILALEKARRRRNSNNIQRRIEIGRQFLLDRIGKDGGWNYGRSNVLGVEAPSYPETTGQALLALGEVESARLRKTLNAAQEQARNCQSAEALSWLQLGLQAHGIVAVAPARRLVCRSLMDSALWILAQAAQRGRNVFLE